MKVLVLNCFIYSLFVFLLSIMLINGYSVKNAPLLTKRPPWLLVCKRSDPNLNECLNNLFYNIFPELEKGIPEMNVDPFEPLHLDRVSVSKGIGPITLAGSLFNLTIAGPSNATPTYTEFDAAKRIYNFGIDIPHLDIRSQYNLKGKVLILPLVGHGAAELKLHKIRTRVTTNVSFPIREGKEIVHIDKMKVRFTVGGMRVKLHNLFNGNKVLGQTVNAFLNQNALEVVAELEDSIGDSLAVIFSDLMNNVYSKMPTDLWFLTDEQYAEYEKEIAKEKPKQSTTTNYGNVKEDMLIVS